MKTYFISLALLSVGITVQSKGVQNDTIGTFTLGEVRVLGNIPQPETELNSDQIQKLNVNRVSEALNWLPGITLSEAGTRNEGIIFLRGFDQRQIPVFMDGIPVYVPFDGSIDLNRLQTSNISKIQISKSLSSLLLGGNTMGGAVNIISARPQHKLEVGAEVSTLWNTSLNIGSKLEKWYFQGGVSYLDRPNYRLPHSFKPIEGLQEGRTRDNSDTKDLQFNVKTGYTPKEGHEYTIGYTSIRSEKGVPVYLGTAGKRNYWRYKDWNKDQISLFTRTPFARNWVVENKVYYDRYYNKLESFDDNTYSTQNSKYAYTSIYNDYTWGGASVFSWKGLKNNTLKAGVNGKYDVHRSHNEGEPVAAQKEYMLSASVEDTWVVLPRLTLLGGIGYFKHKGIKIESYEKKGTGYEIVTYPTSSDDNINYQFAADYKIRQTQNLRFSLSQNSRFASLKERYSYKRGKSVPNPDLKTEHAFNLDLSYNGSYNSLNWYASGYYSFLSDAILEVTGVDANDPLVWQLQNTGKAHYRGFELGIAYTRNLFGIRANYSFTDRVNKTNDSIKFTDVPKSKLNVGFDFNEPYSKIILRTDMNAYSNRLTSSDGKLSTPGFAIYNLSLERRFINSLLVKASVSNLFDKLYYISEGYPLEGRRFQLSVSYNFNLQ